ncbi:MAG TPA: hypothetical protein VL400_25620 [Polyangiaceae bacterium]|nr:hypothetical protein [Polyangiaceae bacterium]
MRALESLLLLLSAAALLVGCSDISGGEVDVLSAPPLEHSADVDELTITEGTMVSVRLYAIAGGGRLDPNEATWTLDGAAVTAVSSTATNEPDNDKPSYFLIVAQKPGDAVFTGSSDFRGGEAKVTIHVVEQTPAP